MKYIRLKSFYLIIIICSIFIVFNLPLHAQHKTDVIWEMQDSILIPVPPPEHPRLYLRTHHASQIKVRLNEPILKSVVEKLKSQATQTLQLKIEWEALQYLVSLDKKLGRAIIDSTLILLKSTKLPEVGDAARYTGRMMVTGAIVYDWLYPLTTPSEKKVFINEFIRLAKTLECGYPPTKQGSVTGHSSESFIMRDMLSAGIAIYDEYPEMYELAAKRFFTQHLPVRNWLYNGNAYHQGDSYGPLRYSWDTYPLMIFDRMGVSDIYNPEQQYVPYYYLYTTRPDGQRMRSGDTFLHSNHGIPRGTPWEQYVGTLFTASYYSDGHLLKQFIRQGGGNEKAHGRILQHEKIFEFLWWNVDLEPSPVNSLPLSRYFGTPFGWMVARTGWDKNSVIAEMKINEYNFNNHQHMDAGSFQIYYHGSLAAESGLYGGTHGSYGSPHNKNYYWRTIAHNSLLIYDPQEQFSPGGDYMNDGGQRLPNNRNEPQNLQMLLDPKYGYKTGEVLAYGIGPDQNIPDYTYLKGDITKAYSSKVREVKRTFSFLNLHNDEVPAALIVYDKIVSSSPDYKKYWLLHSIEEPTVNNNDITVTNTLDGNNGRMINTCLIPEIESLEIKSVGGPGKEYYVFGENFENELRNMSEEDTYERAAWRIEISPKEPAHDHLFLNVIQVMKNDRNRINVKAIHDEKTIGVSISDRIVFFSKYMREIESSFSFTIDKSDHYKILLTDLKPGEWQILKDQEIVLPTAKVNEDGILYFEGTNGAYTLRPWN
ncbi:MAG TPA: heparin/heparin-sulfate lyase HepB [Mariniphaga sp.]|nr:heparin/heparin-sulfate lyase HepB [Mariniphaga sp.]